MGSINEDVYSDDLPKKAWDCWKKADAHLNDWLKESRECFDMVAGDQWTAEDKAALLEMKRQPVVFNRVGTVIDSVIGHQINNRQEVKFVPREMGDVKPNEVLTSAAQWVRDECDAEDEETDAFWDLLVSGVGCTETRMDYEQDQEGKVIIEHVDITQMRWDPNARKKNLTDRKWCARIRHMEREEVEQRWPDKEIQLSPVWDDDKEVPFIEDPRNDYNKLKLNPDLYGEDSKGKFAVLQYQWYEVVHVFKVLSPDTGQIIEVDEDRFEQIKLMLAETGQPEPQSAKVPKRVYKQAFICGPTILEEGPCPCKSDFTFQFMTGKKDRNSGTFYGLVKPMMDPQKWANKFLSQMLHIINTNAKGGLIVEEGAVANIRKFENDFAKADSIAWVKPGGIAKIQPKQLVQIPPNIPALMEFSIASIRDTSGVNLEVLGLADRNQAGILEQQRTQAGLTILAPLFDSFRLYVKTQGRVLAFFIENYISDGRLIRVVGEAGAQYVPLIRQPGVMKYDVVVDAAPTSRDQKEKTYMVLREMVPLMLQMGLPVPPEIIQYAPLPASLAEKFQQAIAQKQEQGPDPAQMAMMQAQLQELLKKIEKLASEVELNKAKTVETYAKAGGEAVNALSTAMAPAPGSFPAQQGALN